MNSEWSLIDLQSLCVLYVNFIFGLDEKSCQRAKRCAINDVFLSRSETLKPGVLVLAIFQIELFSKLFGCLNDSLTLVTSPEVAFRFRYDPNHCAKC